MKSEFSTTATLSAIALSLIVPLLSHPSNAEIKVEATNENLPSDRVSFYCGKINDEATGKTIPSTVAYVPQRQASVPIIVWQTHVPTWDAQARCDTVSPKFQAFYEDGRLNYLTTGEKDGYDIICAAVERQPCKPEDQLFQVKANNNPQAVLEGLTGIIEGQASEPLYQSSGEKIYVSMEELLNTAPTIEEVNSASN